GRDEVVVIGSHNITAEKSSREASFCAHTIQGDEPLIVPSTTADPRFSDNIFTKSGMGFYAGTPLVSPLDGHKIGALCIIDDHARPALDEAQRRILMGLAGLVVQDLEQRRMSSGA
ncbi:GAF domain-containing protein, partial [Lichenihabitans sp. Uapishka_5]